MTTKTANLFRASASALTLVSCALGFADIAHAQSFGGIVPPPQQTTTPPVTPDVVPGVEHDLGTDVTTPYYGNIDPFYGNIDPFWGNIDPFYGNINPFWGNIDPFYGNIDPFWGNIDPFYGNIEPFWGNIDPFTTASSNPAAPAWGNIDPFWSEVSAKWKAASTSWNDALKNPLNVLGYLNAATSLKSAMAQSEAMWGAAVTAQTGKSFNEAFAAPLLAKYGINLNDPTSLSKLSAAKRSEFYLAWYDGLMSYSGRDRVDHWMGTANWNPSLTQQQGNGADTLIGIIDSTVSGDADLQDNVVKSSGQTGFAGGHGAGVTSLIVAAHDGQGVMGIAPMARVAIHNPFDATGTANWGEIKRGILSLKGAGASIINASLGVSGKVLPANWARLFGSSSVAVHKNSTVYVIAAGNQGITQTTNVDWTLAKGTHFIVVGSVDPLGGISDFSNRPGTACLTVGGVCNSTGPLSDGGLLMNHFITAPGELILVSDGLGGTVRRSGTSFAAPLVSGAIALLHDRWPWLAKDPSASVEIILRTAKDLGAPGVDPVYGVGMLDVTASQSPIDMNKLLFYKVENGLATNLTPAQLQTNGLGSTWEANGVGFALFEKVGNSTRDFVVPMSSLLKGRVTTAFGRVEEVQKFLSKKLTDFINKGDKGNFTDVMSYTTPDRGGWRMGIASQDPSNYLSGQDGAVPHSAFRAIAPGNMLAFTAGFGQGAMELGGQAGFGLSTDYAADGGVNPLLAFASGGTFMNTDIALSRNTRVAFGYSERDDLARDDLSRSPLERIAGAAENLRGNAMNVRLSHEFAPGSGLSVAYTRMNEGNALLAVQAVAGLLEGGSNSDALTVGGTFDAGHGMTFAASATAGRSAPQGAGQLTADGAGLVTSAYAVAMTKNGVLGREDRLRVSFAQPMHIERGNLTLHAADIVNRETGEVGVTETSFAVNGGSRVHTAELLYAAPVAEGQGEFSLFGRATVGEVSDYRTGYVAGVRFNLKM